MLDHKYECHAVKLSTCSLRRNMCIFPQAAPPKTCVRMAAKLAADHLHAREPKVGSAVFLLVFVAIGTTQALWYNNQCLLLLLLQAAANVDMARCAITFRDPDALRACFESLDATGKTPILSESTFSEFDEADEADSDTSSAIDRNRTHKRKQKGNNNNTVTNSDELLSLLRTKNNFLASYDAKSRSFGHVFCF